MPTILDRLLGRKPTEPKKEEPQRVSEEAARLRREQLAKEKADMEAARKRAEEQQKQRLEQLAAEERAKLAAKAKGVVGTVAGLVTDAVTGQRTYVVKSGDSLSKIAKEVYGDAKRWPEIYEANKQLIGDNPNLIHPGQTLKIP